MNRKRIIVASALLTLLLAVSAAAQTEPKDPVDVLQNVGRAAGYSPGVTTTSVAATVGQIIKMFLSILGFIFMSYLIYAGYLWMTASGKEETLTKAKAIIRGSIIGLIVALSAYIITATVVDRLTAATRYGEARHALNRSV